MTTAETTAAARAAVEAAGFTPCDASAFVDDATGRAFSFSVESAGGTSATGPAFEAVAHADGRVDAWGNATAFDRRGRERRVSIPR